MIDVSTLTGIEGDAAGKNTAACSGTTIKSGSKCDVKLSAGYTGDGSTETSCTGTTLTAAILTTTGCATDYKQSTDALKTAVSANKAAPTSGTAGTCVAW